LKNFPLNLSNDTNSFNYLILFVVSISIGCIIYVIDLPKRVWFFKKETPTNLIKKKLVADQKIIKDVNIKIFYYNFYDNEVSEKNKSITDKQTTLYHFSFNMFLCALLILLIQVVNCEFNLEKGLVVVNLFLIITCFISFLALLYGKGKMKSYFQRHYIEFIDSQYYTDLKNK
jgi:hypothetical protein